jgi:predicted dehydrogenase
MTESEARVTTLRWGILGTGGIARQFTQDLLLTGHTVAAVGSRTRESAERFATSFGIAAAHPSYQDLVTDATVDLVYVATPHPWHYPHAALALDAGRHVLVEKPFTLNAEQARQLVLQAADRGLLVLEAMWTRWLPHMVRLREILAAGTIGDLRSMTADHTQLLPSDPGHRLNALELGGGALLDLGVYPVSFASQLFGSPQRVQAVGTLRDTGADAQVATMFHYPGGQIATTYSASTSPGPNVAVVVGTRGRIELDRVWYMATGLRVYDAAGNLTEDFHPAIQGRGMQYQADEAERLVDAGRIASDILPPEETVAIMATLDEIRAQIGVRYPGELSQRRPALHLAASGEHLQHRPLGLPVGGDVTELLAFAKVGQHGRDRHALLVLGDDARVDVGGTGHGRGVPQVASHLLDHAGDGALAGGRRPRPGGR